MGLFVPNITFSGDFSLDKFKFNLNALFFQAFSGADRMVRNGLTSIVWTEGGEWLPLVGKPSVNVGAPIRKLEGKYMVIDKVEIALLQIRKAFMHSSMVNIAMECGQGKSTRLMHALYNEKISKSLIVIQPSMLTAVSLYEFMRASHPGLDVRCDLSRSITRAIAYIGGGQFLEALLHGYDFSDAIIVLDESHSVTPVYRVIKTALAAMNWPLVQLTASAGYGIRARRGVTLSQVTGADSAWSERILKAGSQGVMVGVDDGGLYVFPANVLIGATPDIVMIYDTGLRPDPVVRSDGSLELGERVAVQAEIVQMMGRLNRTSVTASYGYYNAKARALADDRPRYYEMILVAFGVVMGLESNVSVETAIGIISYTDFKGGTRTGESTTGNVETKPGVKINSVGLTDTLKSSERGYDDYGYDSGTAGRTAESHGYYLGDEFPRFDTDFVGKYPHGSFVDSRIHSREDGLGTLIKRGIEGLDNTISAWTWVSPGSVTSYSSASDTTSVVDTINVGLRPKAYSTVSFNVRPYDKLRYTTEDVRDTVGGKVPPTFTEDEFNAVMSHWNTLNAAFKGKPSKHIARQYKDYVKQYQSVVSTRSEEADEGLLPFQ